LTTIIWVGYEVYHAYTETTVPQVISKLIQPLNPTLDQTVLQAIKEKQQPSEEELNLPTVLPTPSPEAEMSQFEEAEATSSSQTATESGSLEEEK
jgi:hypothetical protein